MVYLHEVYKSEEHLVWSGNNFWTVDEILDKYYDRQGPPKIENLSFAVFFGGEKEEREAVGTGEDLHSLLTIL